MHGVGVLVGWACVGREDGGDKGGSRSISVRLGGKRQPLLRTPAARPRDPADRAPLPCDRAAIDLVPLPPPAPAYLEATLRMLRRASTSSNRSMNFIGSFCCLVRDGRLSPRDDPPTRCPARSPTDARLCPSCDAHLRHLPCLSRIDAAQILPSMVRASPDAPRPLPRCAKSGPLAARHRQRPRASSQASTTASNAMRVSNPLA